MPRDIQQWYPGHGWEAQFELPQCLFSPRSLLVSLLLPSLQPAGVHMSTLGYQETCEDAVNQCRLASFTEEIAAESFP